MKIRIVDFKTGEPVLSHSFDRQKQLAARKVEHLPAAVSGLLQEELDKVVSKMVK
jgi:hypothetical protein